MEFKCYYSDCSRSYNSKYNLKRHINTNHLCLKNYPCDQCGRIFASKKNVMKHKVSHSDIVLDSGPKPKALKNLQGLDLNVEIQPIVLSRLYVDVIPCLLNPVSNKQSLPSLAPVDLCRISHQSNGKIPLLPILLDHI
jgi:uncharacterized C2H2 Zn-finger protein